MLVLSNAKLGILLRPDTRNACNPEQDLAPWYYSLPPSWYVKSEWIIRSSRTVPTLQRIPTAAFVESLSNDGRRSRVKRSFDGRISGTGTRLMDAITAVFVLRPSPVRGRIPRLHARCVVRVEDVHSLKIPSAKTLSAIVKFGAWRFRHQSMVPRASRETLSKDNQIFNLSTQMDFVWFNIVLFNSVEPFVDIKLAGIFPYDSSAIPPFLLRFHLAYKRVSKDRPSKSKSSLIQETPTIFNKR